MAGKLFAVLLFFFGTAHAADWNNIDRSLLVGSTALIAADWAQTRYIARNPQSFHELNPILGQHPSVGRVNSYFATAIIGNIILADALGNNRRLWLLTVTSVEAFVVARNYGVGIRMAF